MFRFSSIQLHIQQAVSVCISGWRNNRIEAVRLHQLQQELLEESAVSGSYVILIVGSCTISSFGLLSNSVAVIIGAMIIAPLMLPIRSLAFGALGGNVVLFRKGLASVVLGTLLAI